MVDRLGNDSWPVVNSELAWNGERAFCWLYDADAERVYLREATDSMDERLAGQRPKTLAGL
jgi:hypothetical protein